MSCAVEACPRKPVARGWCGIRTRLAMGQSHSSIAAAFDVSRKAISKIANHITWKEVA